MLFACSVLSGCHLFWLDQCIYFNRFPIHLSTRFCRCSIRVSTLISRCSYQFVRWPMKRPRQTPTSRACLARPRYLYCLYLYGSRWGSSRTEILTPVLLESLVTTFNITFTIQPHVLSFLSIFVYDQSAFISLLLYDRDKVDFSRVYSISWGIFGCRECPHLA